MRGSARSLFLAEEIISSVWLFGTDVCKTGEAGFCSQRRGGAAPSAAAVSCCHTHTHADDDIILQGKYAVFNNVEENQTSFLTRAVVKL